MLPFVFATVHVGVAGACVRVAIVALGLFAALESFEEGAMRFFSLLAFGVLLRALLAAVLILHVTLREENPAGRNRSAPPRIGLSRKGGANAPVLFVPSVVVSVKSIRSIALLCALVPSCMFAQHNMSHMSAGVALPLGIPWSRLGSGTSWMPDS